ncbi:MAG: PPC domain-containing DNA-binding protein [Candidatus Jordarchaeum sp.]|uniref:PPC domain-containing DNA-binding protein n=1 Tax=Candidatus Jordarchaeum sp. TaxID=2823881 RepID=UPI004049DC56
MRTVEANFKRIIVAKLEKGDDVLESLVALAKKYEVVSGFFNAIGALSEANIGFFEKGEYKSIKLESDLEVISCIGNISHREGEVVVHTHIVVGDDEGKAFGGHVLNGCIVSVTLEIFLMEIDHRIKRTRDEATGLFLLDF